MVLCQFKKTIKACCSKEVWVEGWGNKGEVREAADNSGILGGRELIDRDVEGPAAEL